MVNNNILIDTKTREIISKEYNFIGVLGENNVSKLIFTLTDFVNGTAILEIEKNFEKNYIQLDSFEKSYILDIKNSLLSNCNEILMQLHITTENQEIFKSKIFSVEVFDEIHATEEIPEEYPEWIDNANSKLSLIDSKINEMDEFKTELQESEIERNNKVDEAINEIQDLTDEYNLNAADKIVEFNLNAAEKEDRLEEIKDIAEDLVDAVTFSTFEADLEVTGRLYIVTPEKMGNAGFKIDTEVTGRLEVEFNG